MNNLKFIVFITSLLLLGACASKPPAPISAVPPDNPSLLRVRMDIDAYIGRDVRWGGVINGVENRADGTWVEIVRYELRDSGRPREGGNSDGRFIASFPDFVDPVVYETGRPLTVVGRIEGQTSRKIGDYDYRFAIVEVEGSYLWRKPAEVRYIHDPYYYWYYDPWFPHHRHYHPYYYY